jgi:long-chain acyl-CoA synthetase
MDKIWLRSYPPGVPAVAQVQAFGSLKAMFDASVTRFADRPACTALGATLTYRQLGERVAQLGAALSCHLGLARGERIALMLPNCLAYPVAVFGAFEAGLQVVNCNPMYTASELAFQLKDSGVAAVIVLEQFQATLADALPGSAVRHVIVARIGDLAPAWRRVAINWVATHQAHATRPRPVPDAIALKHLLDLGADLPAPGIELDSADTAFVQYTGGTTGRPKGALLSHGGMVANVEQVIAWLGGALEPGREVVVTALPLYHVFALLANLLVFTRLGGENVLVADPRKLHALVRLLARTEFSVITGVNTLFDALLSAPGFDAVVDARRGRLKLAVAGGMPVNRRVADAWSAAFGVPLVEGYGLTEASPIVCANRLDIPAFTGKLGLPLPSTELAIVDSEGNELPLGEVGEIRVRGPQVMQGYLHQPEETAKVLSPDGWLRTGDMGRMDASGYVQFVDRCKDIIVVSGFKAFPAEIEEVAKSLAGVREAGAVGVPDERTGEAVALFIVASDPALTVAQVREHCERHLAAYKRPRSIVLRTDLPMSPLGKVLRRELRDLARDSARLAPSPHSMECS